MPDSTLLRRVDQQLISALRSVGEVDRATLAAVTGLPRSTVTDALARLRQHGAIVERPAHIRAAGKVGRPATLVTLSPRTGVIAAVTYTHEAMSAQLMSFDGNTIAESTALHGLSAGVVTPTVDTITTLLTEAGLGTTELACLVLGMPVPIHPTLGTVIARYRAPSAASQLEQDPAEELSGKLAVTVWAENDANLGALGEANFGVAQNLRNFIYLKVAAGVGAGIVLDRRLHRGTSGLAGELAHLHIRDDGPLCTCGGRGCLATQVDSPRLVDLIQPVHGQPLTLADVWTLAADGDVGVIRVLSDLGRTIGRSLADMCVYLNPDGIVLDSTLGPAADAVITGIGEALYHYASPSVASDVHIMAGSLGERAELLGAVALARDKQ